MENTTIRMFYDAYKYLWNVNPRKAGQDLPYLIRTDFSKGESLDFLIDWHTTVF